MRRGKEIIELDATVIDVVTERAFRAKLDNGHEFIAYVPVARLLEVGSIKVGDRIRVHFSPFDMSRGELMTQLSKSECGHESA